MDLNIIKTCFSLGKYLALTPSSFKNKKMSLFQKIYTVSIFLICNVGIIVALIFRKNHYLKMTTLQAILWLFSDLTRYGHLVHIFVVVTCSKRKNLFKLIKKLNKVGSKSVKNSHFRVFIVVNLAILGLILCMFYACLSTLGLNCLKMYQIENYQFYSQVFYMLFACFILKLVLVRYQQQKQKLLGVKCGKNVLKSVKNNLITLRETLDLFNEIFGAVILWNILYISSKSLIYLDNIIKKDLMFQKKKPTGFSIFYFIQCSIMVTFWVIPHNFNCFFFNKKLCFRVKPLR